MSDEMVQEVQTIGPGDVGTLDLNDLTQVFNTVEEVDPNADISDQPPPPPPGTVQLFTVGIAEDSVKVGGDIKQKPGKGGGPGESPDVFAKRVALIERLQQTFPGKCVSMFFTKDGAARLMINLKYKLQAEGQKFHGQTWTEYLNTMVMAIGTSGVDSELRLVTGSAGLGMNDLQKITRLYELAVAGYTIRGEVDWECNMAEAEPDGSYKTVFKSAAAAKWPKEANGLPKLLTEDPFEGKPVRVRWYIKKKLPAAPAA
jgi:hypothetical protein